MKKIIIIHSDMEIGGAETSLLGMLYALDYTKVAVDLFLLNPRGELLNMLPKEVNILPTISRYKALTLPIKEVLFTQDCLVAFARLCSKIVNAWKNRKWHYSDYTYISKQRAHYYALPFLPNLKGRYDLAISFNDPHFIMTDKVQATKKVGWFHTDFKRITVDESLEAKMWGKCDYIVNVSELCKKNFDEKHENISDKSVVIENILAKSFIENQAIKFSVESEMPDEDNVKLLSIGRFSEPKNFDNIPDICRRMLSKGINVKWYIVGYGAEENLIRDKIKEANMEKHVIILGKKDNPYPYIKACDIYVQPSRWEGKCVAVREAQMMHKPVVITDYATSGSQLESGVDGMIVPLDNEKCAEELAKIIKNKAVQEQLVSNTKSRDYSNSVEINRLYEMLN